MRKRNYVQPFFYMAVMDKRADILIASGIVEDLEGAAPDIFGKGGETI